MGRAGCPRGRPASRPDNARRAKRAHAPGPKQITIGGLKTYSEPGFNDRPLMARPMNEPIINDNPQKV